MTDEPQLKYENKGVKLEELPNLRLRYGKLERRFLCLPDTIDPREKKH